MLNDTQRRLLERARAVGIQVTPPDMTHTFPRIAHPDGLHEVTWRQLSLTVAEAECLKET